MKPVKLSEIKKVNAEMFQNQFGADKLIQRIHSVEGSQSGDLIFVSSKEFVTLALKSRASAIVTNEKLAEEFTDNDRFGVLITKNVKLAHAQLKQKYSDRDFKNDQWGEVHPSAVIHPTARIGKGSYVAPHVTIGANVVIGEATRIQPGVVIEEGAQVGSHCVLHANVVIGYNCTLKNSVIIEAGTVIGSEGFGFAQDDQQVSHRIPQTGNVIIEDNVRIGSNNSIDRATYASTRIGKGTKTDNICHFAHNVEVGEDCLITSMFCIAGTSKVGNRAVVSGQSGVIDHIQICDDVVLLHRAGVTKNITEPGVYAGLPHQNLRLYQKNMAQFRKLNELAKEVQKLKKLLHDTVV